MTTADVTSPEPLLAVRDLAIGFATAGGELRALDGVSFDVPREGSVAIVGESGSGKTATALAILRLLPTPPARVLRGDVVLEGEHLFALDERAMQRVRGGKIGFVFQEPLSALNPVYTVGWQVAEAVRLHERVGRGEARRRAIDMLRRVRFPDPERAFDLYPHELSGGMRQRVVIASALVARPRLLIADEPTTALDATTQAEILELLRELSKEQRMSLLIVAHDLALVSEIADEIVVLYAGVVVERGPTKSALASPQHPYTEALLACLPKRRAYRVRGEEGRRLPALAGAAPDLRVKAKGAALDAPAWLGCRFAPRCPKVFSRCEIETPPMYATASGESRCFLADPTKPSHRLALVEERASDPNLRGSDPGIRGSEPGA